MFSAMFTSFMHGFYGGYQPTQTDTTFQTCRAKRFLTVFFFTPNQILKFCLTKSSSRAWTISQSHKIYSMVSVLLLQNIQIYVYLVLFYVRKNLSIKSFGYFETETIGALFFSKSNWERKKLLQFSITYIENLVPSEFPCCLFTISV